MRRNTKPTLRRRTSFFTNFLAFQRRRQQKKKRLKRFPSFLFYSTFLFIVFVCIALPQHKHINIALLSICLCRYVVYGERIYSMQSLVCQNHYYTVMSSFVFLILTFCANIKWYNTYIHMHITPRLQFTKIIYTESECTFIWNIIKNIIFIVCDECTHIPKRWSKPSLPFFSSHFHSLKKYLWHLRKKVH